ATADPSLEPLSLDDAIQQAVAFFDRGSAGGQCKAARQLVKHALLAVGMRRTDFHPLRFGAGMGDGVKTPVTEALKVKIHHHVAGDGARLAVPQANSQ
ncbi:hypothetical protein HP442_28725, partial [Klebsiella pneumoniae]|uniref:hypothetical protein n=1 Tax=Klebsiella pneumoniae TaxID=573 RepID=UPI001BA9263D